MKSAICHLLNNKINYPDGKKFAAIIGETPSKGARSPALWNAAFTANSLDILMLPFDVDSTNLLALLELLDSDQNFIGGAIAVPHKEAVARWLGERVSVEASAIGAVNCLYRDKYGHLCGTNTDGEGALVSFEKIFGSPEDKTVLLLGPGGAGKAVAAFFARAIGDAGKITIVSRSDKGQLYARRLNSRWSSWQNINSLLSNTDIVINCTTIGNINNSDKTPLTTEELSKLPKHATIFDIIYQPSPTKLLQDAGKIGLKILDGMEMNLEQAVLAYGYATNYKFDTKVVREAMQRAKSSL